MKVLFYFPPPGLPRTGPHPWHPPPKPLQGSPPATSYARLPCLLSGGFRRCKVSVSQFSSSEVQVWRGYHQGVGRVGCVPSGSPSREPVSLPSGCCKLPAPLTCGLLLLQVSKVMPDRSYATASASLLPPPSSFKDPVIILGPPHIHNKDRDFCDRQW